MGWMSAICDTHKKVDVELLYNSVMTGSQLVCRPDQFGDQTRWWQDVVEKASTQQSGPPVEQPRKTGKKRGYGQ